MRQTQRSGGSLLRRASCPVAVAFPWFYRRYRVINRNKICSLATYASGKGQSQDVQPQPLALEHVLAELRRAQGTHKLGQGVEAVVHGRGKHMGTAVQWSLRWTASGCFMEEIRGPQLTFKWGYDGHRDSGCWEVDSSGLVRVMECDDHEAVLLTTYVRTGCWLQPHLQDRFDLELLPTPTPGAGSRGSSSGATAGGDTIRAANDSSRSTDRSSISGSSSSNNGRSRSTGRTVGSSSSGGSGSNVNVADVEGVRNSAEPSSSTHGSGGGSGAGGDGGGGAGGAAGTNGGAVQVSSRPTGQKAGARTADDMVAIGVRVRGKRLRVRVLVRQRDWRLLGFDHRMCADTEIWELGEWREWAAGVTYPSSVLHKASNGGQHAYLTHEGAAERWYGMYGGASGGGAAAAAAATALAAAPEVAPVAAAAPTVAATKGTVREQDGKEEAAATVVRLPAPTSFVMPLLPPIPADTSYTFVGGGDGAATATAGTAGRDEHGSNNNGEYDRSSSCRGGNQRRVPLWRAASGHFLVRPVVNGQEGGGYFVLDTGASGFVITPEAAARLGGQAFGEIHAASISGKVAARFIRVNSWALAGLTIQKPVLMVMELEGLVRGAPGEVVGIVGHDLFRRAVVELPELIDRPPGRGDSGGKGNGSAMTQHSSAPRPGFGSGSGWDSASEDEGGASGAEWVPPAPVAVPAASRSGSGTAAPRFGSPAIRSSPAVPAPAGSSVAPPASASAAVEAATTATATATATAAMAASTASNGCGDAAAAVPALAAVAERSAGCGGAADFTSSSSSLTSRASSGGEVSALAATGAGAEATAVASRHAPLSTGSTGARAAGGNGGSGGTDGIGSSLSVSSERRSIESDVDSSLGSSLSRSSSSSTSGRGGGGLGDTGGPSTSSGSSSSSGSGSDKAVGGARRSAGRSQTARAVRRTARTVPYTLHEILLHHPLEYDKDSEWVWHPLIMIANLPHIRLRFAAPDGVVRSSLLMLDSGACGADIMLHARAQRELGLTGRAGSGGGSEGGRTQGHYLRGVGQDPKDFVQLQVLDLPWLEMAGVRFEQVRCMCAAIGGLDISVYSHGILCGDLLARVEWAMDYTHKRIGFRRWTSAPRVSAVDVGA